MTSRFTTRLAGTALALALCLAAAALAQQAPPDPAAWLRSGPMLGPSTMTETTVWLQTRQPVRAQVRFWKQGQPETARLSEPVTAGAERDHIARIPLTGLEFGTRYEYEVYLDGLRVSRPYPLAFQTQPSWLWNANPPVPPDFRFAVGSCAYINDPPYDRPGVPYGGEYEIFTSMAKQKPDFMLWLGDNVYLREADWESEAGIRYRYAHDRATPEMQPLLGAAHHYAAWDDHDFGPNDSDRTYGLREASLRVFQDYWLNPTYGTEGTPGTFTRFQWVDVDFFLLDDRYHRSPNRMPEGPDKRMFGPGQMKWLLESLANSRATFKIVVSGNQILNPLVRYEGLGKFPAEQQELLDFIRTARISGVVFLTGDRHHTELIRRADLQGLYPLYDFTSSPLTSRAADIKEEADNPARVPGTWVRGKRNFGVVEVSGPLDDRRLTLRTYDVQGKELWNHAIRASEVSFPRQN
ncbi:MAG TPA: alkaline phosphatase D family protein [Thermoanaerobaculia bacterium]|nr:alkaline phosphatase D family protein [Thermoanaerobaculia bacterium]